ncbi:hypothetical protein BWQ96_00720 [Gracilariopsis chorda]|uniref:Uncharacterized protein n=1 Tax=Gracilariopsis chorda TaxID=448386 RepID=A0A2V3J4W5_9FLOR|nr:hypothetical protein BWQ96_00720 [Gracilariopsis chorda]|eukprot:PXF49404.1 hypothetical protein BWQ96_00720 [Gracilariopsis chorda]
MQYFLWALPFGFTGYPSKRKRPLSNKWFRICACEAPTLTPDELQVANAAVKVTQLLLKSPEKISTPELLAFNNVKGVPLRSNIWDRSSLECDARKYLSDEKLARTCSGIRWETLSAKAKINLLHSVCNGEGDVTYYDPETTYTVFTFYAHLKRGNCCGVKPTTDGYERTHRCRHCPYTDDGRIASAKMHALKKRIPVIDYVRSKISEDYASMETSLQFDDVSIAAKRDPKTSPQLTAEEQLRSGVFASHPLSKRVVVNKLKRETCNCEECGDAKVVTCKRCNGYTFVLTPEFQKCPQCKEQGYHPCMSCTSYRPPQRTSFYS